MVRNSTNSFTSSDPHHEMPCILAYVSGISSDILSGTLSGIIILGDSLWLRSGGEHSDPELAVEVLIMSLWWRSGGEHSDRELAVAVGVRRGAEEGGRKEEGRKEEGGKKEAGRLA